MTVFFWWEDLKVNRNKDQTSFQSYDQNINSPYWLTDFPYNKAVVCDPKENHAVKMAARNPGDEKRKKDFS